MFMINKKNNSHKISKYQEIFSSALLFGVVQFLTILSKVIVNKIAALLLGPSGVGLIAIIQNAINTTKTITSLGISQSAVRDVAAANSTINSEKIDSAIRSTNFLILLASIFGFVFSLAITPIVISSLFQLELQLKSMLCIALGVMFLTLYEGKLALLRALRSLNTLAKAGIFSALSSLLIAPLGYFILKEDGIVFVAAISSIVAYIVAAHYVRKSRIPSGILWDRNNSIHYKQIINSGAVISFAAILSQASVLIITSYISRKGGTYDVGLYSAGTMIVVGYFSTIIGALMSDYYPRISSYFNDDAKLNDELNRQTIVTTIICIPLVVPFIFLSSEIITTLFSREFNNAQEFVRIGLIGVVTTIFSNQIDIILIVKKENKLYFAICLLFRMTEVLLSAMLYHYHGMAGLGFALAITGMIHFAVMYYFANKLYSVHYEAKTWQQIGLLVLIMVISGILNSIVSGWYKIFCIASVFIGGSIFSYYYAKVHLNINFRGKSKLAN